MSLGFVRRIPKRILVRMLSLQRSIDGMAAVEFAYLAPVLMLMLIGTIEISRAVEIDRRFGTVAQMVGDLVAREEALDDDDMVAIGAIADHIMRPHDTSTLGLSIMAVKAANTNQNDTRIEWSYAKGPGAVAPPKCQNYALPNNLLNTGASAIVVEARYKFEPILTNSIAGAMDWADKSTHIPRGSCVKYNGSNCLLSCPGFN